MQEARTRSHINKEDGISKGKDRHGMEREWKIEERHLVATNMIHHARYRWNEEPKISPRRRKKSSTFSIACMRGDDIHVNDVWWRISYIDSGVWVMVGLIEATDWLIEGTMWFTVHTRDGASQNEGHLLMLGLRIKMDCFHTHKFNPKMLCHGRGLTSWKEIQKQKTKKGKQESRLREWHLLAYSGALQQWHDTHRHGQYRRDDRTHTQHATHTTQSYITTLKRFVY